MSQQQIPHNGIFIALQLLETFSQQSDCGQFGGKRVYLYT